MVMGQFAQAAEAINSPALDAELLLGEKLEDVVAATIGAYALLRLGELERLHDWTENLRNWFPWLPDGAAIRGEHLARLGRHGEALACFAELPRRGLPVFTDGLSYSVDRIRLYVNLGRDHFAGMPISYDDALGLRRRLESYGTFADLREPFLTFTGLDPSRPDDRSLSEDIDDV